MGAQAFDFSMRGIRSLRRPFLQAWAAYSTERGSNGAIPNVLWAPGASAGDLEASTRRLAGRIALTCRSDNGHGRCEVGAQGVAATASALRALAKASQLYPST